MSGKQPTSRASHETCSITSRLIEQVHFANPQGFFHTVIDKRGKRQGFFAGIFPPHNTTLLPAFAAIGPYSYPGLTVAKCGGSLDSQWGLIPKNPLARGSFKAGRFIRKSGLIPRGKLRLRACRGSKTATLAKIWY
jgi:hypothetical protein